MKLSGTLSLSYLARQKLAFFLLAVALIGAAARVGASDAATVVSTIQVTVDYNDGASKVFALPWKPDMTVLAALNLAKANRHGITFVTSGRGDTVFVSGIDDLRNEGSGASKKNWLFSVNEKLADRSCGTYQLQAGDRVLWKFAIYRGGNETGN